jgi:hypothetical protein
VTVLPTVGIRSYAICRRVLRLSFAVCGCCLRLESHAARLRLLFAARKSCRPEGFLGHEVRGSLGRQLKRYVGCPGDRNEDCRACSGPVREDCLFGRFYFHGGNDTKGLVLRLDPAHRLMEHRFHTDEVFQIEIIVLGRHIRIAHHFLNAAQNEPLLLGKEGFGFDLVECGFVDGDGQYISAGKALEVPVLTLYPVNPDKVCRQPDLNRVAILFHTPTDITVTHQRRIQNPRDLNFHILIKRLLDRIDGIGHAHCGWNMTLPLRESVYGQDLKDLARSVQLVNCREADLKSVHIRNKSLNKARLLVGTITYQGMLAPFTGLLDAAVILGLGKGTTAGLGQISWEQQ